VTALLEDRAGGVWVGHSQRGVNCYFEDTWRTFSAETGSLGDDWVTALLEDRAGGLWVGTRGEVSRYLEGTWQTFSLEGGNLGDNWVQALLEDRAGGVWVGTGDPMGSSGRGVSRYFEGAWQTFSVETGSLGHNYVDALLEDRAGGVWVGTWDGGVSRYFEGTWQTFSVESGSLNHNRVDALLEDRTDGVWVGTNGGLSRYFEGTWQTFSVETDSLGDNRVTELLEDRAGGVWVGTWGGGVSYHRPGRYRPWVLLRQLEVEREGKVQSYDLSSGDVPEITPDFPVERLTIRFVGADLDSHPDNIRYFYQLEGRDAKRRPTAEGVAQYENLPPGRYTFVVQSLDEDLTFSPEARLSIVIPAPFWRTEWFWGGMALLAVGAVVTGRRWQRNRRLAALRRGEDPYIVGAAIEEPEKFYGRREILAQVLAALRAGNHVAIYGERRIGKTSLLHQLAHHLRQIRDAEHRYLPVFVSLQIAPSEDRFFYNLMREVANTARKEVGADRLSNLRCDEPRAGYSSLDMAYDLDTTLSALETRGDKPTRLVLLLDEADQMNSYDPHTQGALRGLLMRFPRRILLVWSGRAINRDWRLDTSPWYNLFKHEIRLDAFPKEEEDEIRRLIREPVRGLLDYDDEAVAQILAYSGRKPHAIQRLCSAAVRQALAAERTRVTVEDVQQAHRLLTEEDTARAAEEGEPAVYAVRSPVEQLAEDREGYQPESPQDDG
ncbi:MAG: hypothetical protein E3J21_16940, partial [Anaerolineales bacterium]